MTKQYAIIYPAFTMSGDGLADMPWLLVAPIHKLAYERICGYSLGHQVKFFDYLEKVFSWEEKMITDADLSKNAIRELTNQYVTTHSQIAVEAKNTSFGVK